MYDWLLQENVSAVVIENIQLRQQHDTDKQFNCFTHNFKKKKLTETILRWGRRLGFRIKKVNPAYTSVIGRFKYMKTYGLSVHESAALVIGRRGLGYHERLSKELIDTIKKKVKRHLIAMLGSMEESYKQSKSGMKQRQYLVMMVRKIENFNHRKSSRSISKQHRLWADGAEQPIYYFLLTQSVDTSAWSVPAKE